MTKDLEATTIRLHRVLRAPADIIYRAFLEPNAMCKWIAPYGFIAQSHHSDVRVGGSYRKSFTNFRTGHTHTFGGTYNELVPNQRLRYTDKFEDPNMPDEMEVTVTFRTVTCGTEITIVQKNIPAQIPVEMCYLGWQESLMQLALLVEPEVS